MPIRKHFTNDGLDPLSTGELREYKEMMFGSTGAAADAIAEGYIGGFDELAAFQESLDRNLTKFTFAKHSLDEWRRRYVFPHPKLIDAQLRALGVADGDLEMARGRVVNIDAASIRGWTKRYLIDAPREGAKAGAARVVYVQGTVGSGKSSLNKYITTVLFDDFRSAKVIPSRIECRKLIQHMERALDTPDRWNKVDMVDQFQRFLKLSVVRDIIHYSRSRLDAVGDKTRLVSCGHQDDFPGIGGADFDEFVRESLANCGRAEDDAPKVVASILRAFDVIGRIKPTGRTRVSRPILDGLSNFALDTAIGWYQQAGIRFSLMLDGFDYIEAADFFSERSTQSRVIDTVADWINRDECRIAITCGTWTVEPNVSLTIRRNTRSVIGRRHNQIFSAARARSAYVLAPSMHQLYLAMVRDMSETASTGERRHAPKAILRIIDRVRQSIKRELDLTGGLSIASMFNGNVRHQINYTRDVIYELAASSLRSGSAKDAHGLVGLINFEVANFGRNKSYRLVDLLLYSAGHRFANFVHVRAPEAGTGPRPLTDSDLSDNNIGSGYVGNVLNYHSAYTRPDDLAFLLEKVRILELIKQQGIDRRGRATEGEADETWLRGRFARNNWPVSPDFRLSLCLLVREGMLEVVETERVERFSILPLGVVAVDRLVSKLVYLENIFFGTLIPEWLYKASDDVERAQGVTRWAAASLFHTWLLLRAVRYAESIGAEEGKTQRKFVLGRMLTGVQRSVEAMATADREMHGESGDRPTTLANAKIEAYRKDVLHAKPDRSARPPATSGPALGPTHPSLS